MRKCYQISAHINDYSYFHCIANATRKHHQSDLVRFDNRDKDYLLGLLNRLYKKRLNDVSQFMRDFQWHSATHLKSIFHDSNMMSAPTLR